jgi:succinoglycan biosynthesis protein ExoV
MRLEYFKGIQPNFGDELNTWLWPQLLPGFFDNDPSVLFLGIGSIISPNYEPKAKKIIFGTGYVPAYHPIPNVHNEDWKIFFVRGPRTARMLSLPENLGIGDGATLLRALKMQFRREPHYVGFLPHWESLPRGNWQAACKLAGIRLIDPRAPVERIISEILGCEILIAEAMHGAIVADTLRVPWVPVLPIDNAHREKWFDWADAMCLEFKQHYLWPSSLSELSLATARRPFLSSIVAGLRLMKISWPAEDIIMYAAAQRLSALTKFEPHLSTESTIENATEKMLDKLNQLEALYRK